MIRCENRIVSIPVTFKSKPQITPAVKAGWQKILDIIAGCMNVPASLMILVREFVERDLAIPCCMMISEAVSDSVTNAFSGRMRGEIYIFMRENSPGEYILHYPITVPA